MEIILLCLVTDPILKFRHSFSKDYYWSNLTLNSNTLCQSLNESFSENKNLVTKINEWKKGNFNVILLSNKPLCEWWCAEQEPITIKFQICACSFVSLLFIYYYYLAIRTVSYSINFILFFIFFYLFYWICFCVDTENKINK